MLFSSLTVRNPEVLTFFPVKFEGIVEADETYYGGSPRRSHRNPTAPKKLSRSKRGRGTDKTPILAVVERDGRVRRVRARVVNKVEHKTIFSFIRTNVKEGSTIYTDEFNAYNFLDNLNYIHSTVQHGKQEFVRGLVHTNTVEGFFSYLKNGIRGAYKHCSDKYLQNYVNEYAFKWSHRGDQEGMFKNLLNLASYQIR